MVDNWLRSNTLDMAPKKTEAIILKGQRKHEGVVFQARDKIIIPKRTVKYLGVTLDDKIIFSEHSKMICKKAETLASILRRQMPYVKGQTDKTRIVYVNVVKSTMLYAAPI